MAARAASRGLFSALLGTQHLFQSLHITHTLKKIPLVRSTYEYLYQRCVPRETLTVNAFGHHLELDPEDMGMSRALLLSGGEWERAETAVFCSFVGEGMTVIDIGANIGYFTLLAARLVGALGRVVAFEPSPRNAALLGRNIRANGYHNVTTVAKAVSAVSGIAQFEIEPASSGTHHIATSSSRPNSIPVETVSLDDYFTERGQRVDFIKMDAEGSEPSILAGMGTVIDGNPNLALMTEFAPAAIRELGASSEAFLSDLRRAGFVIHRIVDGATPQLLAEDSDAALVTTLASESASTNLLCLRGGASNERMQP